MNHGQDQTLMLAQLTEITAKESAYLERTAARLERQGIDMAWVQSLDTSDERSEMLDAFVSRYGRLQDTLGDKFLRALLLVSLEKPGSQLDNLLRAEKLGWVESVETWVQIRELRNRLVHEYVTSAEDLLAALRQALTAVQVLVQTQRRMAARAKQLTAQTHP